MIICSHRKTNAWRKTHFGERTSAVRSDISSNDTWSSGRRAFEIDVEHDVAVDVVIIAAFVMTVVVVEKVRCRSED